VRLTDFSLKLHQMRLAAGLHPDPLGSALQRLLAGFKGPGKGSYKGRGNGKRREQQNWTADLTLWLHLYGDAEETLVYNAHAGSVHLNCHRFVFLVCFVAKRYILQQKCLKK